MSEFKVGDSVRLKEGLKSGQMVNGAFVPTFFKGYLPIIYTSPMGVLLSNKYWFDREMVEKVHVPLSLSEIIDRNYKATVKRDKIDQFTNQIDFIDKIKEEIEELRESYYSYHFDHLNGEFDHKELADIALVCFAMAKHYDIDLLKVMEEKTIFNETRED